MRFFLADDTAPTVDPSLKGIFGTVNNPGVGGNSADAYGTLLNMLNLGLNLILVVAGLFTLFNLILAGFTFLTSGGDAKKMSEAQSKILMTVIGLGIVVAAPVIAGVLGFIIFHNWTAILRPEIKTINDFQ